MGIRERLRKGVRKRVRKGKRSRKTDSRRDAPDPDRTTNRERLAKLKAALEQAGGEVPTGNDDTRDQFARAQDTATVAPPVRDATLDPFGSPERMEQLGRGGGGMQDASDQREPRVDDLARGGRGDGETMEDLVRGTGRSADERDVRGPTMDEFAMVGIDEEEDPDGLLDWGDE